MIMRAVLRTIVPAAFPAVTAGWAASAGHDPAGPPVAADVPALQAMVENPEPIVLVLLLGGVIASLILIRGQALRRAAQSVNRLPGDAPRS